MKIYIASRFRNREAVKVLAARLHDLGIETTQTWPEVDFSCSGYGETRYDPMGEQKAAVRGLPRSTRRIRSSLTPSIANKHLEACTSRLVMPLGWVSGLLLSARG